MSDDVALYEDLQALWDALEGEDEEELTEKAMAILPDLLTELQGWRNSVPAVSPATKDLRAKLANPPVGEDEGEWANSIVAEVPALLDQVDLLHDQVEYWAGEFLDQGKERDAHREDAKNVRIAWEKERAGYDAGCLYSANRAAAALKAQEAAEDALADARATCTKCGGL